MLLSIVIPIFNEKDNICKLYERLVGSLTWNLPFEVVFIDDGSTDKTLSLKKLHQKDPHFKYINVSSTD